MPRTSTRLIPQPVTSTVIDCGKISNILWPGSVSVGSLLAKRHTSTATLDEASVGIDGFYVRVDPRAKTRCIDGRHDPKLDEASLGPQVPGGAPGAALAYRLGVDSGSLTKGTFLADAEAMIDDYARLGFAPGGHRDEQNHGKATVGCGAIDAMDGILATMTDARLVNDHKRVVELLLGEAFNKDDYLRVMGAAVVVNGRSKDYFAARAKVLDRLEDKSPESTAILKGVHQECFVIVNLVPRTTFASNRFASKFQGVQAFGYDLWWSIEIANRLMPRPDQARSRERFVMARVMTTVATLMALTDGSQRLMLRSEVPAIEE